MTSLWSTPFDACDLADAAAVVEAVEDALVALLLSGVGGAPPARDRRRRNVAPPRARGPVPASRSRQR